MNNANEPTLSVILPAYNREDFVAEAIESILTQTFTDFELIIIDDGSTDLTAAIIDGYAKRDSRIKIITNEVNIGLIASLTKAHRLARGRYIARMDSDDISLPERLALQVAYLEAHPEIDIVGTYFNRIDENGNCTQPNNQRVCGSNILWFRMFFYLQIVNASAMAQREIFTRFNENGLEAEFVHSEDIAFWLRIGFHARFENIPIELYQIRSHPGRVTSLGNTVQMRSTEKAIQRALRLALSKEVSLDAIRCIREMKMDCSAPAAIEAIDYTYALYRWFRNTYPLTREDLKAIRRFLGEYYFKLIIGYARKDSSVSLLALGRFLSLLRTGSDILFWLTRFKDERRQRKALKQPR